MTRKEKTFQGKWSHIFKVRVELGRKDQDGGD